MCAIGMEVGLDRNCTRVWEELGITPDLHIHMIVVTRVHKRLIFVGPHEAPIWSKQFNRWHQYLSWTCLADGEGR